MGSQDSNLDSQIQSLESYRWTTPHGVRKPEKPYAIASCQSREKYARSQFEALQGTTAQAEGQQGGEQTEPYNRSITQIHFHASHLLIQEFTIQMDIERAGCQEQHDADKPRAEDHVGDAARARRRLGNVVILEPRIHRSQADAKTCQGTRDKQDDGYREEHQIGISFKEQIGHHD